MDMVTTVGTADIGLVPVEKNDYSDLVHTNKMFEFVARRRNEHDLARAIIDLHEKPDKREQMVKNSYKKFESVS